MTRDTQSTVLLVLGLVVGRLAIEGNYQSYVRTGLFWPLLLSAATLVAIGAWSLWNGRTPAREDEGTPDGPDVVVDPHASIPALHPGHRERVGWLLLVPVAVLLLVAPAPLGAFAAQRDSANRTAGTGDAAYFDALPESRDGAVDLTFQQTLVRTFFDDSRAIQDVPVRLTGFVAPADEAGHFRLTRFVVGCCAADGSPIQLLVRTEQPIPATDTWLEVVVTWTGTVIGDSTTTRLPLMELQSAREVDVPEQPYEY